MADVAAFDRHLGAGPGQVRGRSGAGAGPVRGYSLGGVNACQFAARLADKASALIVGDIGAVVGCDWSFTTRLPGVAASPVGVGRGPGGGGALSGVFLPSDRPGLGILLRHR